MTALAAWQAAHADLPRLDRDVLLSHVLHLTRAQLITRPDRALADSELCRLAQGATRLRAGEPLAYILGEREFWGLTFTVNASVLIPRPETELLVELVAELARARATHTRGDDAAKPALRILELGTGSGAIALALAHELRVMATVITATDVSPEALAVARANGQRHGAAVDWRLGDWFDACAGSYDFLVSNPPYVRAGDTHLSALRFEPRRALVAGPDGLDDLRHIVDGAPAHLTSGGWLLLEHGWDQGQDVRRLLSQRGFQAVATRQDLAGHERVTLGRRNDAAGAPQR